MRAFAELNTSGLTEFSPSSRGTLYYAEEAGREPARLIRRFDGYISPEQIPTYAEIIKECEAWLVWHPRLAEVVRVEPIIEIGRDYVTRKYYDLGNSLARYDDPDEELPSSSELKKMRRRFSNARGRSDDSRDRLIEEILARSILESTYKTVFDMADTQKFVILEPRMTLEHLKRWSAPGT